MTDNLKPIVGKSKVLEEQKRKEEAIRRRKRKEEIEKRKKKQRMKAYAVLASLITVIIAGVIAIIVMLMPKKDSPIIENERTTAAKEDKEYDIVKNALVSEKMDLSTITFEESDYKYKECDAEVLKKLEDKLGESEVIDFIYEHREAYPEGTLKSLGNYSELEDYILKYPFEIKKEQTSITRINTSEETREVPLLIQWDDRWGYYPYGDDAIGLSGCGPTCLSMVSMALSGSGIYTPTYMADFSMNYGYYLKGYGTKWNLFTDGVKKLGFTSEVIEKKEEAMKKALDEGKYLILSMSKGIFTQFGHFIVIYDYTEDGKFVVNDPNSVIRSNTTYSFSEFHDQIKNIWAIGNK